MSRSSKDKSLSFQHRPDILEAARAGDMKKLHDLIQNTVVDAVSYNNKNCLPPSLYNPALRANLDMFDYFISAYQVRNAWPRDLASIEESFAADINVRDQWGSSTFAMASKSGNIKVVGYLLAKGSKIIDKDNNGDSPLMVAAKCGHLDVVKLLVAHGADLTGKNRNGKVAHELATEEGFTEVADFLKMAATSKYPASFCNFRR
jgi:ankyrin repeat protein